MAELKQIHAQIYRTELHLSQDNLASTKLLETVCNLLDSTDIIGYARKLFDQIQTPNTFTWNTLFKAHSKARKNPNFSISSLYKEMLYRGTKPNGITFSFVSKACSDEFFLGLFHAHLLQFGFCCDVYVLNSLIYGYAISGSIDSARKLFDELSYKDLISWTVTINGYVRSNRAKEALDLFFLMREEQVGIDEVTVVAILTACAQLGDLNLGRRLERLVRESGFEFNSYMNNALIDMYAKCGSMSDARKHFDEMVNKNLVSWNSIVSGYARSGDMDTAKRLFQRMPKKNEISWSALLNGYLQNGDFKEALMMFHEMKVQGIIPNDASVAGAIAACAHLGALEMGKEIHVSLDEQKVRSDVVLGTALVDMYVKCGCLEISRELFDGMSKKNLVSYNVMILGLAVHGRASDCFEIFTEMLKARVRPDSVTFVGILSGCVHAGLVEEGKEYFNRMTTIYGIAPRAEHISCMVYLMGRNGNLEEAHEFIKSSPLKPDVIIWGALLSACRVHGNVKLGEYVARQILDLDPDHGGAYVLLSSINAAASRWDEVTKIRKKMKETGVESRPGRSWIELNGKVHEFCAGDSLHPDITDILLMLGLMEFRTA
ncbi:Pentatricopeptide repeat [Macleaya cordata]|uniref:Pentatricopeptide repeat n=1 Tax=Macleaya cordata TaxID=56857 RepID=A0A200RAZ4_MACCD|nr:Pentatricopeptide repeat [Macleaya cordata]